MDVTEVYCENVLWPLKDSGFRNGLQLSEGKCGIETGINDQTTDTCVHF
jgi:hypothetical protein